MSSYTATAVVPKPSSSVQPYAQPYASSNPAPAPKTSRNGPTAAAMPAVPSPGRYRHPRMTEVAKRRSANSFSTKNIQSAALNVVVLLGTLFAGDSVHSMLSAIVKTTSLESYLELTPWLVVAFVRLFLVSNIYFALQPVLPYVSKPDDVDDIPLNPSQRALLGLPRSRSGTPSSQSGEGTGRYITPPRYRRSSPSQFAGTPQSGMTNRADYSGSPLSTSRFAVGFSPTPQQASGTPSQSQRFSGSPFSPSSPLFKKAFMSPEPRTDVIPNADFTESTRSLLAGSTSTSSFQSTLRQSQSTRGRGRAQEPGTPSPQTREKNKISLQPGINYKWLYEKGYKVGKNGNVEYE